MGPLEWFVIGVVVLSCSAAIILTIRERIWLRQQRSKIDEMYGWLQGYRKDDEDGPARR